MNYENILSKKSLGLKPSGIRKFFDIAAGVPDIISLSVGEPDFKTPWAIRRESIRILEKGKTAYTSNSGLAPLRNAVSEYFKRTIHTEYKPDSEIIITVGGSEAIDISIRALVNPGDEVIIVEPCFVSYSPIVELTGGIPISAQTRAEDNFKLTAERLKSLITPRTKALMISYPSNPTGAVMRKSELEDIARILRGTDIMVITDEIYSELTYGEPHSSIAELEGMRERTIVVNGFSKAFAMTGWRLGFVAAPRPVAEQILKIHQYAIMCSPTVSQYAAIIALNDCMDEVREMAEEYDNRRRFVLERLNEIGLDCFTPEGAFYVFPSIKSTGMTSQEFCKRLIEEKKVAVVPGDAFGECGEGFVRISYAYSMKHLTTALNRIEEYVKEISK
ncbi:MAG: aminotransferase class I/II-fold pyridoxal phosphate-dependent enzyme [Oscillospiraceae bacterium]|nr:aminotransferase class I/II-fold pyridoxal phosphate-dependent enzyme [Oscillospiraceae bacterium]